ncbi:MAG: cyclic nucleotide-binding domain-containing protein [Thiobacillus sp.]|nr:cyclic nucleotide-binding domain-containing protein [Thiobacillus sp.]
MLDRERLQRFSPLDTLSAEGLSRAAEAMTERRLAIGDILFRKGDNDTLAFFLLDGNVTLRSDPGAQPLLIRGGSDSALVPLSRLKPRRYTAIADTPVTVAVIEEAPLNELLAVDRVDNYEVDEVGATDPAWLFKLMANPLYAKVPAEHFATLFCRMEAVAARDGQILVRQGEPCEHYYIVRQGKVRLWCSLSGDTPILIEELGEGDAFGDDSLVRGAPAELSYIMAGDGLLLRLSKADFDRLLKPALAEWIAN